MDYFEERDNVCDFQGHRTTATASEIQSFYEGKSVFITGGTGLIGSLLIEHILRICPKINKIYLLMRPKKGKSLEERLTQLFETEEFCKVRRLHKNLIDKVQIISGDIALPWCGISDSDKQLLIDNVDIVYHAAAALRMDEKLRIAYCMNVQSTEHLLEIGTQMKKLKAFIHVSTFYCNSFRSDISEKFYETEYSAEELKTLVNLLGDRELGALMTKVIGKYRNSYSFTKAIAEKVVQKYSEKIPVAVTRPSIVIGCEKEPLVSWINNIYGPTGVSLAASIGLMRVWYGSPKKVADIIPADKVVSAMLPIAWQVAKYHEIGRKLEVPVYNIVSSVKSPQTWHDYMTGTEYYAKLDKMIYKQFVRMYDFHMEEKYWLYLLKIWIHHLLFGIIVDQIMKLQGKKPMLVNGFIRIFNFNEQLGRYASNEWVCSQHNMDKLWSEMSNIDKQVFNFDMSNFDWKKYHSTTIRGILIYILKDDLTDLKNSQKRYIRMMNTITALKFGCYGVVIFFLRNYIYNSYKFFSNVFL